MFVEYHGTELRTATGPARIDDAGNPRIEGPTWRGRDVAYGLALAALSFFAVIGAVGFLIALRDLEGARLDAALLGATALLEASLGLIVWRLARARGLTWREVGFRRPERWGPLVVAWFGAYFLLTLWAAGLAALRQLGVDTERIEGGNTLPIESGDATLALIVLGFSVVALAPFCEELFFRSLVYRGLKRGRSATSALVGSGILFGAFHFSWAVLIPFAGIGMLFAWANERTGSLWTSVIAHALFNGLAFTVSVLAARGDL